jgi:GNAT superfamily N-acetyltransferase
MPSIRIQAVTSARGRRTFVTFPWAVYEGDPSWVPPLISERLEYLDPARGPFYERAEVALFLARRGRAVVGTVAAFVDHHRNHHTGKSEGGFGFFETLDDYAVARALLDAACGWLRAHGVSAVRGPTSFTDSDTPGVLIDGVDCPPAMLEAHTPPYYRDFLERYGMEKDEDLFAWRVFRAQFDGKLKGSMEQITRVADAALRRANATIRRVHLDKWEEEIAITHRLFNATLEHLPDHAPMTEAEFRRTADQIRLLLDPDLALFAEVDGEPVAFGIALPDINRVLLHLNGRLFPFGWLKFKRLVRQIDGVTFKLMGVLEEYRHRGIDAMLYLAVVRAFCEKGYEWLEGSVTSEFNPMINLIAGRLGAERYKHYRLYRMAL